MPPVLWDAYNVPDPFTSTEDNLSSVIEERFADAYASQIGHLQHAAQEEMAMVESDIGRLRNIAWSAQRSASEQARRADVARAAIREREEDTYAVQTALKQTLEAIKMQQSTLAASRASLERTKLQHAEAKAQADQEVARMRAHYNRVALQGQAEKQTIANLERELATARTETLSEQQAAREQAQRAEAARKAVEQAKAGLACRDAVAEQTLREAVQRLEADFKRERADFLEQDRRSLARVYAIEQQAQKEQWGATVGRSITRPQAASIPVAVPGSMAHQTAATAATAAYRLGLLPAGQVAVAARS